MVITPITKVSHVRYLRKHLGKLSSSSIPYDSHRMTILFFTLSGLDLLNSLDALSEETKQGFIEWIYMQQIDSGSDDSLQYGRFGFRGSPCNGSLFQSDCCNLTMTYCALASLLILGDDLSRVDRQAILCGLQKYQKEDGRFIQALVEEEDDLRVTYCAAAICFILNDWSFIDKPKMLHYIQQCQNYENGFGQRPGTESHGGTTFCAVASLYMMDELNNISCNTKDSIIKWCIQRQISGFQGRPYKDPDSCYSFWVGASLCLLDSFKLVNDKQNIEFLDSAQELMIGGFSKYPNSYPDLMHTYLSISALALRVTTEICSPDHLQPLYPALNISIRAYEHLKKLQQEWMNAGH